VTSRDWKWWIFWSWIREIDTKILISSRSTVRLHFFCDRGRTLIFLSTALIFCLFYDRISMICDLTWCEGSFWKVCCIWHYDVDIGTDVYQCRGKSECRSTYRCHSPIRELWRIVSYITSYCYRDTPQYFSSCRISYRSYPYAMSASSYKNINQ